MTPGPGRGAVRGPPAPAGGPSASLRTRHILFVFSGAFSSCESPPVSSEDFVRAGLCAEFIGRIPVRVALQQLTDHDLLRVLTEASRSYLHAACSSITLSDCA